MELQIEFEKLFGKSEEAHQQDIAKQYELLLPQQYESVRGYLQNDNYLSSEELTRVLQDARLEKDELSLKLEEKLEKISPEDRQAIGNYLWELHEQLKDVPFEIDPNASYRLMNYQIRPGTEEDTRVKSQIDTLNQEISDLREKQGISIVPGGFLANFLHNYRTELQLEKRIDHLTTIIAERQDPSLNPNLRYSWDDVKGELAKIGIDKDTLLKTGYMEQLLSGKQTGLVTLEVNIDGEETRKLQGKIHFRDGELFVKKVENTLEIPKSYLGYKFTEEDTQKLLTDSNMGRKVTLESKNGHSFEGYIGVDKDLNRLTVVSADSFRINNILLGKELTPEQQDKLRAGEKVLIEGMTSKKTGELFDGFVQINPAKRALEFQTVKKTETLDLAATPADAAQLTPPAQGEKEATQQAVKKGKKSKPEKDEHTQTVTKTEVAVAGTVKRESTEETTTQGKGANLQAAKKEQKPHQDVTVTQKTEKKKIRQPKH